MEKDLKVEEEIVLNLEFLNQIRVAARKKVSDETLTNHMRGLYGDLSAVCSNIMALDYIENFDKK